MASGITTNDSKYGFKEYITHLSKRLLPPFWIAMLVYTILEIFRAQLVGYGNIKIIFPGLINAIYGSGKIPVVGSFGHKRVEIMSFKYHKQKQLTYLISQTYQLLYFNVKTLLAM